MEQLQNQDIIIVKSNIRNKLIEKLNEEGLKNIKVLSKEELWKKYYFTFDEHTIYYLMKKYNYNIHVAKMYLNNLYNVGEFDYNNEKIKKIKDLKEELIANNLLIFNPNFKKYLTNKNIVIYNYYDLTKKDYKLIEELKKNNHITIYNETLPEYKHQFIYEADTLEEEVSFIAGDIISKIHNGININNIKICGANGEYTSVIKRIFKWYNIPISINESTIYSTTIGQDFIKKLTSNKNEVIESLKENYKNDIDAINIINKLVKLINKYAWNDNLLEIKELIIEDLKNEKISTEQYTNEVKIINNLNEKEELDHIYLIGFNQGEIPKCYKDEEYFNDELKEKLQIDTTNDLNKSEYNNWLYEIKNTNNLTITTKKTSSLGEHYLSSLNDELNLQIKKVNLNYNYSDLYNKIILTEKLDKLVKYNEKTSDLEFLYSNYNDIQYNTYNPVYQPIDKLKLQEYLNKKLVLSYSAMNTYYQCGFRYYLSNILKLNIYEETFYTVLGNLFHYVLSNYYKENFDLKKEYHKYLNNCTYQFNAREKFFLEYLEEELAFIIKTIQKQNETNSLTNILAEEKIEIDKSTNELNVTFKGFVDKIMLNDNKDTISIIDYKTGNPTLNLNNIIYGLDLQLPTYIYLAKNRFPNAKIAGFYLQKILNNEITKDFKHTYEALKEDKLKLQGYSNSDIETLQKFDSGYYDSKVIKGMKTSTKGLSTKKVLNDIQIDKLSNITEEKINEAITNIINANFKINPKKIGMNNVGCEFCSFKDICFMKEEMLEHLKEYKNMEFLGDDDNDTN